MARSLLMSVALVLACAAAASAGFLTGRSGGPDLRAARQTGVASGARSGARVGQWFGYRAGYKVGYRAGYKRVYAIAYREAAGR